MPTFKEEPQFENCNLILYGKGRDANGNAIVKVGFPNSRVFSIQTNGTLPETHRILQGSGKEISDSELNTIGKEVADYIKEFGSKEQKAKLKIYGNKMAKGGSVKNGISTGNGYIHLEEIPNGLKITLEEDGKEDLEDVGEDEYLEEKFGDWFDSIRGNSELLYFSDLGDQAGLGLTNAPGITDGYYYDDDGELKSYEDSKVFYYDNYMIKDFVRELKDNGEVIFTKANTMAKGGKVETIKDIEAHTDYSLVTDSNEVEDILNYIGKSDEIGEYDGLFVKEQDGDYVSVYGFSGTVPSHGKKLTLLQGREASGDDLGLFKKGGSVESRISVLEKAMNSPMASEAAKKAFKEAIEKLKNRKAEGGMAGDSWDGGDESELFPGDERFFGEGGQVKGAERNKMIYKYVIDAIDGSGYDEDLKTDKEKIEFLWRTFKSEYGHEIKRVGPQRAFVEWLQGLPSSFNVDYENYRIIEIGKEWGILKPDATEKQEDKFIETWWARVFMGVRAAARKNKVELSTAGVMKDGGNVTEGEKGMTREDIWKSMSVDQRRKFMEKHAAFIKKEHRKDSKNTALNTDSWATHLYYELPRAIKQSLYLYDYFGSDKKAKGGVISEDKIKKGDAVTWRPDPLDDATYTGIVSDEPSVVKTKGFEKSPLYGKKMFRVKYGDKFTTISARSIIKHQSAKKSKSSNVGAGDQVNITDSKSLYKGKSGYIVGEHSKKMWTVKVLVNGKETNALVSKSGVKPVMGKGGKTSGKTEKYDGVDVPKSEYNVNDMVYSYQNPDYKARVAFKQFRPWEGLGKPHENDAWAYKVTLKDAEGYTRSSKWMSANSMSKTKKDKY